MLDAYWLFGEPNTDIARNGARLDEYISLFKHSCLFQRRLNLSDLMIVGAPNFRKAYLSDPEFKKLADSDIVQISYLHAENDGRGPPMDLAGVTNFHLRENLFYPEEREFYGGGGGEGFINQLQAKSASTLIVRDGSQRDPIFTARIMAAMGSPYLQQHLEGDRALFEDCTRELQTELASRGTPLGAIWFEAGWQPDGTCRWTVPTVLDRMFRRMDHLSADRRKQIAETIWRFYRTHLFRAESDLMQVDPVVPPESDFYVDVMYGKAPASFFHPLEDENLHVYRVATDLDDATLYRHLDFNTIVDVRTRGAAYFEAASRIDLQPELPEEDRIHLDEVRAAHVGAALNEYKHAAVALLSERFSVLRQVKWQRELVLRVATMIDHAAVDGKGRPRPVVSTLVMSAITKAGAAVPFDTLVALNMEARPFARYLMNFTTPMLHIADATVAAGAENLANRLRLAALLGVEPRSRMDARLIATKASGLTDSTTLYGAIQRSETP